MNVSFSRLLWILDSGATKHVCCQKSFFDKIQPYDTCLNWNTASHIKISDIEIVILILFNESFSNEGKIRLKNVLFVSELNINFLSLNWFKQKKYDIHFESNLCQIKKELKIKIEDIYWNNFTYFDFKSQQSEKALIGNIDLWHARMGHIGQKVLNKLSNASKRIKYFKNALEHKICKICVQINPIFKMNKNPSDKINTFLKNVFLNICEPIKFFMSFKKRYFATFLNQV